MPWNRGSPLFASISAALRYLRVTRALQFPRSCLRPSWCKGSRRLSNRRPIFPPLPYVVSWRTCRRTAGLKKCHPSLAPPKSRDPLVMHDTRTDGIDVLTPSLNYGHFIPDAIASVEKQEVDAHHFVQDGGS